MALNKTYLAQTLKLAFQRQAAKKSKTDDPAKALEELCDDIASCIDGYVRQAIVNTTITGVSPSGAVTGTGTGTIS